MSPHSSHRTTTQKPPLQQVLLRTAQQDSPALAKISSTCSLTEPNSCRSVLSLILHRQIITCGPLAHPDATHHILLLSAVQFLKDYIARYCLCLVKLLGFKEGGKVACLQFLGYMTHRKRSQKSPLWQGSRIFPHIPASLTTQLPRLMDRQLQLFCLQRYRLNPHLLRLAPAGQIAPSCLR